MQNFTLFPTTVPKIAIPNPHKRTPSLHRISMLASPDSTLSATGESVVFKMEEEQPPLPPLPGHISQQQRTRKSTPSPEDIGRAVTTHSPIDGRTPTQAMSTAGAKYTPSLYQSPVITSPQPPSSLGMGSATTLVAQPAPTANVPTMTNKSPIDPSPIVPIRSMFPVYDPSMPLAQQAYVPQRPIPARLSGLPAFGVPSRDSLSIPFSVPTPVAAQRTAPASILNFPSDAMSVNAGPRISTQRELEKLWEASHGTEPGCTITSFDLEMARTEEATFVFGSHPSLPFYTLQTYDTNEIAIGKTCPTRQHRSPLSGASQPAPEPLKRDVVLCPLEPMERRQPPNDGLVAFIFPKLAALLAINQSAALAKEYNLAPTDRDDIEAQAVRRAAKQEACHLRFNARGGFYELEHPAIGRAAVGGDFATKSPLPSSPTTVRSITGKPVLHIIISQEGSPLPSIHVVDPNASRRTGASIMTPTTAAPSSAGPGMRRLSSLPQPDTNSTFSPSSEFPPLATLDLTAQTLHIDANSILELMPSLFSIDCVVSALLSVAVADASTNPAMGAMEISKPRPAPASRYGYGYPNGASGARSIFNGAPGSIRGVGGGTRPGSVKSYAGSVFYATIAEREEAEEEAKLMRRTHEADVRGGSSKHNSKSKSSRTWFGRLTQPVSESSDSEESSPAGLSRRERKKRQKQKKQIVLREFDLEKLGHYQSGDRKGEELPAVTRGVIGGLVVGLKLIVWLLTLVVQVVTWLLVNITRGVTSEKF